MTIDPAHLFVGDMHAGGRVGVATLVNQLACCVQIYCWHFSAKYGVIRAMFLYSPKYMYDWSQS
ncbi:MAG: hypothetical protein RBR22_12800 [Desulfuromonas sp.]|nr:hypothetical protein [Desulfuromonas sp.]